MDRFLWAFGILTTFLLTGEPSNALPTRSNAVKYLQRYGYLKVPDDELKSPLSDEEITKGIRLYQDFMGLEQTGTLDQATLEKMEKPRCGVPDIVDEKISERYSFLGGRWNQRRLTFKLLSFPSGLLRKESARELTIGFKSWESVSPLWIKRVTRRSPSAIVSKFVTGDHGDGAPFEEPWGPLAHALTTYQSGSSEIHFNDAYTWKISGGGDGYFVRNTAAHEMGHILGLGHSRLRNALMYAEYNESTSSPQADDIAAIQALYSDSPDTPIPLNENLGSCSARFDSVTTVLDGSIYAFSDNYFWELNEEGIVEDSLETIENVWGFSGDIDASLTHDGFTDFFQGTYVRRFENQRSIQGYPKLISEQYPGMPSNIDAAWSGDGLIYFLKGDQYWVFNSGTNKAYTGYPRPISKWSGLPNSIDAAVQWNDNTYFFKDGQYWRFSDNHETKDSKDPQKSNKWWPGCFDGSLSEFSDESDANGAGSTFTVGRSVQVAISLVLFRRVFI